MTVHEMHRDVKLIQKAYNKGEVSGDTAREMMFKICVELSKVEAHNLKLNHLEIAKELEFFFQQIEDYHSAQICYEHGVSIKNYMDTKDKLKETKKGIEKM